MKITINVDCSPEEARTFMGLPDIKPMQEALLKDLEAQVRANLQAMSPEALLKTWLPASLQSAGEAQKLFMSQLQNFMTGIAGTKNA